jgi:hypothetical protein
MAVTLFSRPEPLLLYSSSSSIDLTRLSGPRSRPTTTQKICGMIMSMINSNDTIGNLTPDLPACGCAATCPDIIVAVAEIPHVLMRGN